MSTNEEPADSDPSEDETLREREKASEREFYYKVGVTFGLLAILWLFAWKISKADFSSFTFDFSQLLSLILALFSILLSAMFYFKATDTSNAFYNNTYKFMKSVGEVLGRMDERIGRQLDNIEKGQTRLEGKVESKGDVRPVASTESVRDDMGEDK